MANRKFVSCPHCGSEEGYYTKIDYLRVRADFDFDGNPIYSSGSGIPNSAEERREGKLAYCADCDKVICRLTTLRNGGVKDV